VTHHASRRFWEYYRALPRGVRRLADKSFDRLKTDPSHTSLRLKKIGHFWSVRVGLHYRALGTDAGNDAVIWFWIGHHAEYDRLITR
jgi:hypothetical protein